MALVQVEPLVGIALPGQRSYVPKLGGWTISGGVARPQVFMDLDGPAAAMIVVDRPQAPPPPPKDIVRVDPQPQRIARKGPKAVIAKRGTPSIPILRDLADESYRLLDNAIEICRPLGVRGQSLIQEGWKVEFRPRQGRFHGWCRPSDRLIAIFVSPVLSKDDAFDTIRHEFAHAVTRRQWPHTRSHGDEWKQCASSLGARPERCRANTEEEAEYFQKTAKWLLRIRGTNEIVGAYKRRPAAADWDRRWIVGRREETYGKLELVPAPNQT